MIPIDYPLLGQAVDHYKSKGFRYVEAPWMVSRDITVLTCPDDDLVFRTQDGDLVGSAEQGMIAKNLPRDVLFVACGPCFRRLDNVHDGYHFDHFMKVELGIRVDSILRAARERDVLITAAIDFFQTITDHDLDIVITPDGYDINISGIEIGSYGFRRIQDYYWVYGTGLALPRFSQLR